MTMAVKFAGKIFLSVAIFSIGFFNCVMPNCGGTGTGNGVMIGKLYQVGGKGPAQGASMIMRSRDYLPDLAVLSKRSAADSVFVASTRTNDSGYYQFDSVPDGIFIIEGRDSYNNCVFIDSVKVDSSLFQGDTLKLPPDTLKFPATIQGTFAPNDDSTKAYVRIYGLDTCIKINASGVFSIENIPEGALRLDISLIRGGQKTSDTVMVVTEAGKSVVIDSIDFRNLSNSENDLCNELAGSQYIPAILAGILCVARDSSGVFYVIDKVSQGMRCFVSRNDSLHRKTMEGSSIVGERYYFLTIQDTMQLVFENYNGWRDIFLCGKNASAKCDSLLDSHMHSGERSIDSLAPGWKDVCRYLQFETPNCYALSIAKAEDITNKYVTNFPPTTHIEYLARQQTGQYLLVTRTEYDWNGDVVVHYGMPAQMKMREIVRFMRASDGGSTWIRFLVDSKLFEAVFRVKMDSTGVHPGGTFLNIEGDTLDLERINPNEEALANLGFHCSHDITYY
jgi:hypothetical protein